MFEKLFAESGLSFDRLKAFLEVGSAGSIVKAANGDPVRQSQYSRQIKELEDFFRTRLVERQTKGIRYTANGKELARLSRFFLLGLSNFQRGCLGEEQSFRIGASATFIQHFLLPALSVEALQKSGTRYATEIGTAEEIERRLHTLSLDFGIVATSRLSRPLQTKPLWTWKLQLWIPKTFGLTNAKAAQAFANQTLPLAAPSQELRDLGALPFQWYEPRLECASFIDARAALEQGRVPAILPDFLAPPKASFIRVRIPSFDSAIFQFHITWNPRLLRLNPVIAKTRDWLAEALAA
ncbi:MAG TPA: LysR family transcriptional regulator [Candidatus Dormibacteraeota bacterium]|nr:LysR family transcriptional regulator [Candidatus Dormibacteraeota bacterium]